MRLLADPLQLTLRGEALELLPVEPPAVEFIRSGEGEKGPTCGNPFTYICPGCGHLQTVAQRDMKRVCPNCVDAWAWKEASRAWDRLRAGALYYSIHWKARHVSVSFDHQKTPRTVEELADQRHEVYRVLKAMGFYGGIAVFHPWRKHCLGCGEPFEARGCATCKPSPGFEWVESPHYHVVGYGAINAEDRPEGVVVVTIPPGKRRSWTATIKYVLDHCGAPEGRHSITWFGAWSYNKIPRRKIERFLVCPYKRKVPTQCPKCGREMVPLIQLTGEFNAPDYRSHGDRPPPPWERYKILWILDKEEDPAVQRPGPGAMQTW